MFVKILEKERFEDMRAQTEFTLELSGNESQQLNRIHCLIKFCPYGALCNFYRNVNYLLVFYSSPSTCEPCLQVWYIVPITLICTVPFETNHRS